MCVCVCVCVSTVAPVGGDVGGQVEETAVAQQTGPQLNADDAKYEEHEEAQHQDVAEHRQRVEQQRHQDAHA